MKLMLVDDSAVLCRMLRAVLADAPGVEVVGEARSAAAALESLAQQPIDVVVMDWSMPGMNGVDATAAVRRHWPRTVVVGFTSTADPAVRAGFLDAGPQRSSRKTTPWRWCNTSTPSARRSRRSTDDQPPT